MRVCVLTRVTPRLGATDPMCGEFRQWTLNEYCMGTPPPIKSSSESHGRVGLPVAADVVCVAWVLEGHEVVVKDEREIFEKVCTSSPGGAAAFLDFSRHPVGSTIPQARGEKLQGVREDPS